MKPFLIALTLVSALGGQTPLFYFQSGAGRELVVREVILPKTGAWESQWEFPLLLPDPFSERSSALFLTEFLLGPGHTILNPLGPTKLLTNSARQATSGPDAFSIRANGLSPGMPRCTLLTSPNGVEFAAMDYGQAPDLKIWDWATGNFLRWIPHPSPPPGKPALSGFSYIQNASDVNGDSWDDIFFQDWTLRRRSLWLPGWANGPINLDGFHRRFGHTIKSQTSPIRCC